MIKAIIDWHKSESNSQLNISQIYSAIEKYLKQYPVLISFSACLLSLLLEIFFHNAQTTSLLVTSFGAIYLALKYKLDQASYHKALFEERFAIFKAIDEIHRNWLAGNGVNRETINTLNDTIKKSYYLFGSSTYEFIKMFRQAIIDLVYLQEQSPEAEKVKNAQILLHKLNNLESDESLLRRFEELKIDSY